MYVPIDILTKFKLIPIVKDDSFTFFSVELWCLLPELNQNMTETN